MADLVNHPPHYTSGRLEVIDFIEDQKLPYHLGNVVKYVARAGKKKGADPVEDLKKARWYLDRYIDLLDGVLQGEDLVLATLAVNPAFLPIREDHAQFLGARLTDLACEYNKRAHLHALQYRIWGPK